MATIHTNDNFENLSFKPFDINNNILLDNLSDPDMNIIHSQNFKNIDTSYFSVESLFKGTTYPKASSFSILHINIRSLKKHFESFKLLLSKLNYEFKIICFSETWCSDENVKHDSLFQLSNYKVIHQIRGNDRTGGGIIYMFTVHLFTN